VISCVNKCGQVRKTDVDVFEALACDSFTLKSSRVTANDDDRAHDENLWGQDKPKESFMLDVAKKGPPILPPHLLQVRMMCDQF